MLCGCTNDTCSDNRSSVPLAGFYDLEGESIRLDSLLIYGLNGMQDSTLVTVPGTPVSQTYLPMRPGSDQTTWVVSYKQKALDYPQLNDTLRLEYTSRPYFASAECGVVMIYHIDKLLYTRHFIDSVGISDSTINNVDIERIKIFFKTSSQDQDEQENNRALKP